MEQVQVLFITSVNPHGYSTTLQFLCGTDVTALTPIATIDCGDSQGFLAKDFQAGFDEGVTYFVKGMATNQDGTVESAVVEFTTPLAKGAPEITEVIVEFP
jgi:hypothetical protein